ncbi:MAG: InlB B-repeat-containing protein, partial [Bacteroidaceae bacterium]|nr:InlB B-repeat-containing protein [Bacteroidaceae bacterium]
MKKIFMILMVVLLLCTTSITWAKLTALNGVITVTFVVDPEGAGDILLSGSKKTSAQAFSGMEMTISATSNPGYEFAGWYIDDELKGTDASSFKFITAESNMTVVAKFNALAASYLTLAVKAGNEDKGTVGVTPLGTSTEQGYKYTSGTEVTVKAIPNKGYLFTHWEDANGEVLSTAASYTFTINTDMAVYAVFSELENYNPDLISFPGCEGWGRFTTGGRAVDSRGSKVYYVTRLDDTGEEGTLRWACTTGDDTPRTVLFKVAGTIYLT